jgi:Fe-S-cluster containining protein
VALNRGQKRNGDAEELCLSCGLCCNGVLFADVQLQPGDSPERLRALGLALSRLSGSGGRATQTGASSQGAPAHPPKFRQPCAALEGCLCRIYPERPHYCREFECALFKEVKAGRVTGTEALRLIRATLRKAATVRRRLRALGDTEEHRPLRQRFLRTAKRLERAGLDETNAELYSKLTLAAHDLNLILSQSFYPGRRSQV